MAPNSPSPLCAPRSGPISALVSKSCALPRLNDKNGKLWSDQQSHLHLSCKTQVSIGQPNFANPVVLLRSPYRISFAYAGRDGIWKNTWQNASELPATVRMTVRDATSGRTLSISTTALVHVDLPAACATEKARTIALASREETTTNLTIIRRRRAPPNSGPDVDDNAMTPTCSPRPSARDGFIIVAVLWILIALATLASIYSIYINNSALAVSVMDDGLQAEALVSASLELTAYRLTVPKNDQKSDPADPRQVWLSAGASQCRGEFFVGNRADRSQRGPESFAGGFFCLPRRIK